MLAASQLNHLDWLIIIAVVAGTLGAALLFTRRAGKGIEEFFVSGRSLPWWLAGTSIVATTFACDTPLAITELIRSRGIFANWFWWCFAGGHMLGVVMLARLWRRSRVMTDISLIEIRYHGRSATVLQVFRAGYFGIVWNMIVIGWVTRAMLAIFSAALNTPLTGENAAISVAGFNLAGHHAHIAAVAILMSVACLYSLTSGLWGVVISDLLQFLIAMVGAIVLAVYAISAAGGMDAILTHPELAGTQRLDVVPDLSQWGWEMPATMFFIYLGLLWYTDRTADSGGYIAQRLLAAKDERHGTLAMLWFVIAHYALRPWPWILAALASLVLLPDTRHIDAYPTLIMTVLPAGLRGLLIASLLAAFISTVNTQLNWGASYLTKDVYLRLIRPNADGKELVWVGRIITAALMILGATVSYHIGSIEQAWKFLALLGAGSGLVLVGRWLWWRINAWSEIAVLVSALTCGIVLRFILPNFAGWLPQLADKLGLQPGFALPYSQELLLTISLSTAAWLIVTFITSPTPPEKLRDFYRRTRPPGPGWRSVAAQCNLIQPRGVLRWIALTWLLGVTFVFSGLFGIGHLLLGQPRRGAVELLITAVAASAFYYANKRTGSKITPPPEMAQKPAIIRANQAKTPDNCPS